MIERYILVSDEVYVYTLDTSSKDYKTLEDFEKEEIENAKKEGIDIDEYEEEILLKAHDKYWEWVYEYHIEADEVNDRLNNLYEENQQLKQQKRFLKIHNDYYIQVGDDRELFDLHKPADIRSLCSILNRENGFSELQCEYNDKEYVE